MEKEFRKLYNNEQKKRKTFNVFVQLKTRSSHNIEQNNNILDYFNPTVIDREKRFWPLTNKFF